MAEFRRIQITLFVILMLQFTAVAGQNPLSFTVRAGDEVTLPCENVINQDCSSTTWLSSRKGETTTVALIEHGQIKDGIPKAKSDRLSLREKCSLVIKNVTEEDVGRYTCRQFYRSGQQQGPDTVVHLSVVNMEELKNTDDTVTLICSVLTYSGCDHSVKWLYEGDENDVKITPHTCSASVSFPPHLHQKLLKCNVTDKKNGNTLLCNVGPQSSHKKTGNTTVGTDNTPTTPDWLLYIIVAVGVTALLAAIIIVVVIRRKKTKRNNTQTNENIGLSLNPAETQSAPETSQDMADPEGGVFYASISHTKKTSSKAQARGKDADADDEAVTYSTVKAPPSAAAAASADVSNLYATINKPHQ
ncbi:uncharacterized protein LOC116056199 [Sander lucioperca]|uniref:uncharacterized protein LOC116056199 n=1 Tax=Sander lucioperca TaxID=283035 RepID=UPI001653E4F8|nr:uncharacterized protein LOC116056199 [Sander lucioperca]XP_035851092.1 uncharacterized protein LOC116056199 [Sander lucioperca]